MSLNALILAADSALRTLWAEPRASRPTPQAATAELVMNDAERRESRLWEQAKADKIAASEAEFAERISVPEDRKAVPRLQATPEELDKFNKNAPAQASAPSAPVKPAPKTYPPLESSSK